jgi:hypothetical protein
MYCTKENLKGVVHGVYKLLRCNKVVNGKPVTVFIFRVYLDPPIGGIKGREIPPYGGYPGV